MTARAVGVACAASLVAGIIATPHVIAQDKRRYETVTVKPCPAEDQIPGPARGTAGGTNASISPGRFNVPCVTAEQLIFLAYAGAGAREDERLLNQNPGAASDDKKVRGGPSWVHSYRDKWAIEATAPGVTEREILMGAMLRTLLEERFKLKLRREREDVDMFALTVGKGGLKMQPMKPGDCDRASSIQRRETEVRQHNPRAEHGLDLPGSSSRSSPRGCQHARSHRHRSHRSREFIIRLEFHPDDNTPGIKWPPERTPTRPQAATIFTALEQQLGLKLETSAARVPDESIEKPGRPGLWLR